LSGRTMEPHAGAVLSNGPAARLNQAAAAQHARSKPKF
jgi:hypothetical protein